MTLAPLRYGFVAAVSLVLHNVIIIVGDAAGLPLISSVLISFCVVVVVGYLLHSRLTFCAPVAWSGFQRYALAMAINIPLSFTMIWLWHVAAGLPMIWASPIATLFMMVVNFQLSRWAIIRAAASSEQRDDLC